MLISKHFPKDEHYCVCGHPWGYHGQGRGCSMPLGPSGLPHGRNEPLVGRCPCEADKHGNVKAQEGCDECWCGTKHWENDVCINGHPFGQTEAEYDAALTAYAQLWFAVEKGYHDITGEWLQR